MDRLTEQRLYRCCWVPGNSKVMRQLCRGAEYRMGVEGDRLWTWLGLNPTSEMAQTARAVVEPIRDRPTSETLE